VRQGRPGPDAARISTARVVEMSRGVSCLLLDFDVLASVPWCCFSPSQLLGPSWHPSQGTVLFAPFGSFDEPWDHPKSIHYAYDHAASERIWHI